MNPRALAMIVAAIALIFAVVGTAIAGPDALVSKITKSKVKKVAKKQANRVLDKREPTLSVNSAKSAGNAETASAVGPNAVTGAGVLDGSLTGADVDEATLGTPTGGLEVVSATSAVNSDSPKSVTPQCPPGKRYIFGGYSLGGNAGTPPDELANVVLSEFSPNADGRRIIITAREEEPFAGNWSMSGSAICANAP